MAPPDSLYFVYLHKGKVEMSRSSECEGPGLQLSKLTCDFNVDANDLSVTPDKFKLQWQCSSSHKLRHEGHAISIRPVNNDNTNARYLFAFPRPLLLKGESGEISFAHLATEELRKRLVDPKSSWVQMHFRPSTISESTKTDSFLVQSRASNLQYSTNDVLFEFPSTSDNSPSRQLWAQSAKLKKASPYFESLFSSEGFTETEHKIQPPRIDTGKLDRIEKRTAVAGGSSTEVMKRESTQSDEKDVVSSTMDLEFEDSDMEDDSYPPPAPSPLIHRIVVRQVAYRTLFSFLHYLETDNCHFSVLSSLLPSDASTNSRPSSSALPTCSPKSMYRLADLYEHQQLRQLAYESIQSQLGSNNSLCEMFSDLSADYPEIKGLTMKAVLDNWEAVKDSDEMKRIQGELEEGKLEKRKVALLFELFGKLKPANA